MDNVTIQRIQFTHDDHDTGTDTKQEVVKSVNSWISNPTPSLSCGTGARQTEGNMYLLTRKTYPWKLTFEHHICKYEQYICISKILVGWDENCPLTTECWHYTGHVAWLTIDQACLWFTKKFNSVKVHRNMQLMLAFNIPCITIVTHLAGNRLMHLVIESSPYADYWFCS